MLLAFSKKPSTIFSEVSTIPKGKNCINNKNNDNNNHPYIKCITWQRTETDPRICKISEIFFDWPILKYS